MPDCYFGLLGLPSHTPLQVCSTHSALDAAPLSHSPLPPPKNPILDDKTQKACGSGGTTAGLALGNHLSGYGARVRAYGVCDDPDYFYGFIDGLYR